MLRLSVLAGGNSTEHDVSMLSASYIMDSLNKAKYDISLITIPKEKETGWIRQLLENPPDIVLSALHGGLGENGAIQGLLECMGIPYIGSKVMSSAISLDKQMAKQLMTLNSVQVPEGVLVKHSAPLNEHLAKIREIGFPLVVKPNSGGSSIGVKIVSSELSLIDAVEQVKREYKDDVLIERYIKGMEVTCGVVETKDGLEVLTVLDIETDNEFFDYEAKYTEHMSKVELSRLPEFMQTMIKEIAKKVFSVLCCTGYGRVDMIVADEQIYVIEMNTLPGLTPHSLIPKAATSGGTTFAQFLDSLINFELEKQTH